MEPGGGEGTLKEVREGEDECVIQLVYVQETLPLPPRRVMSKDRHMPHVCAFTSLRVYKKILPCSKVSPSPARPLPALGRGSGAVHFLDNVGGPEFLKRRLEVGRG